MKASRGFARRRRALKAMCAAATMLVAAVAATTAAGATPPLKPIDPQNWVMPDNMTWADYKPVPGTNWGDPSLTPSIQKWKVALVVVDFLDQQFIISQPTGSHIFGNPQPGVAQVPREDVPEFYRDFLNTPSMLNNFVTMNGYWMEDSLGRYGVLLDAFGPYRMAGNMYEYFLNDAGNAGSACPTGTASNCRRDIRTEARAAWIADVGPVVANEYDNIFFTNAGHDESSTWQEFGEMKFQTRDDVTEEFGNPDQTKPNWAPTRYIPWTSFAAAQNNWPNASGNTSVEAESSGMGTYAHELSHNLTIGDNYNNPYGIPLRRSYTGPWDMMSRGSFNGPGGPHTRWHIPPRQGGSLGSNHNLRNRMKLGFVSEANVLRLDRDALANSGVIVAKVTARAADPGPTGLTGINLVLTGGDRTPACSISTNPDCPGTGYNNYTLEVVQRIGNDSFTPGHGVLISRTKNADSAPFVWIMDAHPENFNRIDFRRPNGDPAMISFGDYRQLADATFNAGLNSGSQFEYTDTANSLHLYVVNVQKNAQGVLSYTLGVRSLAGAGPHTRGVSVRSAAAQTVTQSAVCKFPVRNTGTAGAVPPGHPEDVSAYATSDVYRLSASATGTGWSAQLKNALVTANFGRGTNVPVYVGRTETSSASSTVTLTATSESDPSKSATGKCHVTAS
jgi:M6 family metalloprotease-like protein